MRLKGNCFYKILRNVRNVFRYTKNLMMTTSIDLRCGKHSALYALSAHSANIPQNEGRCLQGLRNVRNVRNVLRYLYTCAHAYARTHTRMGAGKHSALYAHSASVDKMGAGDEECAQNIPQTFRKHSAIQKMEIICQEMGVMNYAFFGC